MGLIQNELRKNQPNASQCLTRNGVQASHMKKGQNVVYKFEDIYGMIILLSIGLGVGILVLIGELVFQKNKIANIKLQVRRRPTEGAQANTRLIFLA